MFTEGSLAHTAHSFDSVEAVWSPTGVGGDESSELSGSISDTLPHRPAWLFGLGFYRTRRVLLWHNTIRSTANYRIC